MRHALAVALLVLSGGCGGGGSDRTPSGPSARATPSPPALPQVLDGITGGLVATAQVSPPQPSRNERIAVRATGYVLREQFFNFEPIHLWPAEEDYVHQLVYTHGGDGSEIGMLRWQAAGFTVTLTPEIAEDERARAAYEAAVPEAGRASGLDLRLGPGGPVLVKIDPDAFFGFPNICGFTFYRLERFRIIGADILYPNVATAGGSRLCPTAIAAHELGHVLGLQHVDAPEAVMRPGSRNSTFSPREDQTLFMMYRHRRPGNSFPDRDPALFGLTARRPRSTVIVD